MTLSEYKKYYESPAFLKALRADRGPFGAMYGKRKTVFRVWAPGAEEVTLRLYEAGTPTEGEKKQEVSMYRETSFSFTCTVKGNLDGIYYVYAVKRDGEISECTDPYAKACGANGVRSMVIDLKGTDPVGWKADAKWVQSKPSTTICELHIKDFSWFMEEFKDSPYRGGYKAFTQDSRGLRHLKELGITHVQLLPFYDYATVDEGGDPESFNWGYDPQHYNIPEGSYATNPADGHVRVRECKEMIKALHDAGIGVIMDVVYNHTYYTDSNFNVLAPGYYYRQTEEGEYSNGSGCGNEFASERTMAAAFIRESLLYWAREYHIDGFRFDLMGILDTDLMAAVRRDMDICFGKKNILLYGEPWTCGPISMDKEFTPADKSHLAMLPAGVGFFNDVIRDAIKGSVFDSAAGGFVNGGIGMEQRIAEGIAAFIGDNWAERPRSYLQSMNYVSVHDNLTLWDKLKWTKAAREAAMLRSQDTEVSGVEQSEEQTDGVTESKTEQFGGVTEGMTEQIGGVTVDEAQIDFVSRDEELIAQNKLAAAIVMTCLGTPIFQAGEEWARTKKGCGDSYKSSPEINCLDYSRAEEYDDLAYYYKGLIALRSNLPVYSLRKEKADESVRVIESPEKSVIATIGADIWLCYNAGDAFEVQLPEGNWTLMLDGDASDYREREERTVVSGKVQIGPVQAVMYVKEQNKKK